MSATRAEIEAFRLSRERPVEQLRWWVTHDGPLVRTRIERSENLMAWLRDGALSPALLADLVEAVLEIATRLNPAGTPINPQQVPGATARVSTASPTSESICENGGPEKPSEMVERVARALYECPGSSFLAKIDMVEPAWEALRYEYKDHFRVNARAAIEAMREPTLEQARHMGSLLGEGTPATRRWQWVWQELIDTALAPRK